MFNMNKFILDMRLMEQWCMYFVSVVKVECAVRRTSMVFFPLLLGSFSFADGRMSSFQLHTNLLEVTLFSLERGAVTSASCQLVVTSSVPVGADALGAALSTTKSESMKLFSEHSLNLKWRTKS